MEEILELLNIDIPYNTRLSEIENITNNIDSNYPILNLNIVSPQQNYEENTFVITPKGLQNSKRGGKDGIVLFLVIDGRGANGSNGISISDMIPLLERYGAYNAANLDGGGSSSLVIDDELINNPRGYAYTGARYLPNAWIVKK